MVSKHSQITIHTEHESNVNESTPNRETNEPPVKRFKHLDRVSKLLEEEAEDENSDSMPQLSREKQEIDNYINTKVNKEEMKSDPFNYWLQ